MVPGAGTGHVDQRKRVPMLFLVHLLDLGLLTADQSVTVLRHLATHSIPLGRIARVEGMMTTHAVMDTLSLQAARPGARFGELAMELGFLEEGQISALILAQIRRQPRVEDIVVELGLLTQEQVTEARRTFLHRREE
jgi:hypothetical protein